MISSRRMARNMVGSCVWKNVKNRTQLAYVCCEFSSALKNYLEIWLHQATCRCNGRCRQRSSGTDARQIFGNIRRQTEWNRTIRFQLTVRVVHVEFEVRNVDETGVLMDIHHVRIQTCQM